MKHRTFKLPHRLQLRRQAGLAAPAFTLIEMIVVVAIVAMIFAFAAPYTLSAIQAASLSTAGDTLMQKISLAQQRALTENRPVGLDFYFYDKDGVQACHAIQLVTYDAATSQATPLEAPAYWSEGRALLVEGELSPLFASGKFTATDTGPAVLEPFKALEATFYRIMFYPNGSTSLRVPLRNAYLTLIAVQNYQEDLTDPPANFYTVQVDPVTGRTRSYRP